MIKLDIQMHKKIFNFIYINKKKFENYKFPDFYS